MKKLFVIFFLAILVLSVIPVHGEAQLVPCGGCAEFDSLTGVCLAQQPNCEFCHIFVLIQNILNIFLFPIVPSIATLMIVIGGFFLLTGGASPGELLQGGGKGDPAGLKRGKSILTATVIGLIVVYGAWLFINLIFATFGAVQWQGFGEWWQIQCTLSGLQTLVF